LKRFEYSASAAHEQPLDPNEEWSPEALVLAGLIKCSLASLAFFAERQKIDVRGGGSADGVVTKRDSDGRWAFVEILCGLDVELHPKPDDEQLQAVLDSAEWGCFIGASLTVKPRYEWRVNGEVVERSS
jgi:organic hydroperoxide reductase OsmC/OhrA